MRRAAPQCCSRSPAVLQVAAHTENILLKPRRRRTSMKPRMNFYKAAPDTIKALVAVEDQIKASGLEQSLIELVKTRASQINGCAFCIHMHTADARKYGETEQRLYLLNAWRESPLYTERERAALACTEALVMKASLAASASSTEKARSSTRS